MVFIILTVVLLSMFSLHENANSVVQEMEKHGIVNDYGIVAPTELIEV